MSKRAATKTLGISRTVVNDLMTIRGAIAFYDDALNRLVNRKLVSSRLRDRIIILAVSEVDEPQNDRDRGDA